MPHVEMPDKAFIEQKSEDFLENGLLDSKELLKILKRRYGSRIIGEGGESLVVPLEGKDSVVVAYNYRGLRPSDARQSFYTHRIYSILFPHNFPRFYASIGRHQPAAKYGDFRDVAISGTIRERIEKPPLLKRVLRFIRVPSFGTKYPFAAVLETCEREGIPVPIIDKDGDKDNFVNGADGGEYYVDGFISFYEDRKLDVEKVINYMGRAGYSEDDQQMVRFSFERLEKLREGTKGTKKDTQKEPE